MKHQRLDPPAAPLDADPPLAADPDADAVEDEDPADPAADFLTMVKRSVAEKEREEREREALRPHWRPPELLAAPPPGSDPDDDAPSCSPVSGPLVSCPDARPETYEVISADRWNKAKMTDFLRMLAATHNVTAAARSVGMSRQSAYKLRARLKGQPFDLAWETAFRHGYDNLAHAALDRALNGVEVPHYHDGKLVGTSRRYDERLTVALLAMRNRRGAPGLGRFGAAAEYYSERWDAMLDRIATGPVIWDGEPQDEQELLDALREKHAPEPSRHAPVEPDGQPDYRYPNQRRRW